MTKVNKITTLSTKKLWKYISGHKKKKLRLVYRFLVLNSSACR